MARALEDAQVKLHSELGSHVEILTQSIQHSIDGIHIEHAVQEAVAEANSLCEQADMTGKRSPSSALLTVVSTWDHALYSWRVLTRACHAVISTAACGADTGGEQPHGLCVAAAWILYSQLSAAVHAVHDSAASQSDWPCMAALCDTFGVAWDQPQLQAALERGTSQRMAGLLQCSSDDETWVWHAAGVLLAWAAVHGQAPVPDLATPSGPLSPSSLAGAMRAFAGSHALAQGGVLDTARAALRGTVQELSAAWLAGLSGPADAGPHHWASMQAQVQQQVDNQLSTVCARLDSLAHAVQASASAWWTHLAPAASNLQELLPATSSARQLLRMQPLWAQGEDVARRAAGCAPSSQKVLLAPLAAAIRDAAARPASPLAPAALVYIAQCWYGRLAQQLASADGQLDAAGWLATLPPPGAAATVAVYSQLQPALAQVQSLPRSALATVLARPELLKLPWQDANRAWQFARAVQLPKPVQQVRATLHVQAQAVATQVCAQALRQAAKSAGELAQASAALVSLLHAAPRSSRVWPELCSMLSLQLDPQSSWGRALLRASGQLAPALAGASSDVWTTLAAASLGEALPSDMLRPAAAWADTVSDGSIAQAAAAALRAMREAPDTWWQLLHEATGLLWGAGAGPASVAQSWSALVAAVAGDGEPTEQWQLSAAVPRACELALKPVQAAAATCVKLLEQVQPETAHAMRAQQQQQNADEVEPSALLTALQISPSLASALAEPLAAQLTSWAEATPSSVPGVACLCAWIAELNEQTNGGLQAAQDQALACLRQAVEHVLAEPLRAGEDIALYIAQLQEAAHVPDLVAWRTTQALTSITQSAHVADVLAWTPRANGAGSIRTSATATSLWQISSSAASIGQVQRWGAVCAGIRAALRSFKPADPTPQQLSQAYTAAIAAGCGAAMCGFPAGGEASLAGGEGDSPRMGAQVLPRGTLSTSEVATAVQSAVDDFWLAAHGGQVIARALRCTWASAAVCPALGGAASGLSTALSQRAAGKYIAPAPVPARIVPQPTLLDAAPAVQSWPAWWKRRAGTVQSSQATRAGAGAHGTLGVWWEDASDGLVFGPGLLPSAQADLAAVLPCARHTHVARDDCEPFHEVVLQALLVEDADDGFGAAQGIGATLGSAGEAAAASVASTAAAPVASGWHNLASSVGSNTSKLLQNLVALPPQGQRAAGVQGGDAASMVLDFM